MADFIDLTNDCDSVCDLTLESLDSDSEIEFDVKKFKPTQIVNPVTKMRSLRQVILVTILSYITMIQSCLVSELNCH